MSAIKAGLILLICLAALLRVNSQDIHFEEQTTMTDVLQAILNDPQFLALSNQDQLRLLVLIYNTLENHLNEQQNDVKKKRNTPSNLKFLRKLTNF
jgi:ribosomal protein S15P/S13E